MKILSSEIIEMEGEEVSVTLNMASGDIRKIRVKSCLDYDYFVEMNGIKKNPYTVLKAEYRLKERIRRGVVIDSVNYDLVESYKLGKSKPFTHKIEKTKRKGFLVAIGLEHPVTYKEVD